MEQPDTDAGKALGVAWFTAIEELTSTALMGDNTADRVRAAEAILQYCIAMGQSINTPFMPETKPPVEDLEDDE